MNKPYTLKEISNAAAVEICGVKFYKEKETALSKAMSGDVGRFWAATIRVGELNSETEYTFTAFVFQLETPKLVENSYRNFAFVACNPVAYRNDNDHFVSVEDVSSVAFSGGWHDSKSEQEDFVLRCAKGG